MRWGEDNSNWKGDAATPSVKRKRAQRWFQIEGRLCGKPECGRPAEHRHHIDENPGNNDPANIAFYCARHHLLLHHPPEAPQPCTHCGKPAKPRYFGECQACYAYRKRTGRDRPWTVDGRKEGASVYHPRPAKPVVKCCECGGDARPSRRGRCRKCYDAWRYRQQRAA